jgi:hypothetical protein
MKADHRPSVSRLFIAARLRSAKAGAFALPLLCALTACGGGAASAAPPQPPPSTEPTAATTDTPPAETSPAGEATTPEPALASSAAPSGAAAPAPAKVEFPPHATVDQAIKAVPQGQPRMNMADDALRAPLLDLKQYDKCKIPRSTKVTMAVAVYDGAAVGADITSKPKNAKIEACVDEVVRSMTWSKVPSLNTVNATF